MVAEFYIIPDSFTENRTSSKEEIENKTKKLAIDFAYIRQYKDTNRLFIHSAIYNTIFINGKTIYDLLYDNDIDNDVLDRDVRLSLMKIIVETENTSYTIEEVKEVLLPLHNESICHGLIGFNNVKDVNPNFQVVYDLKGWLDFRRYYLKLYPKNGSFFIEECIKYFPNLHFHDRNKETVQHLLYNCSHKIVHHLAALNDKFKQCQEQGLNRSQVLTKFSIFAELDETASLEGDARRKPNFTFDFDYNGRTIPICCEPHLKLCYNDNYPGDSSYSKDRRIYFHEGIPTIFDGKILIGHIGNHL